MNNNKNLKLLEILRKKKMSQADLAKKSGVMPYQVNKLVQDKNTNIFLSTAKDICSALCVSIDEVFNTENYSRKANYILLDEFGDIFRAGDINPDILEASNDGILTIIRLSDITVYKHGHWIPLEEYNENHLAD